MWCPSCGDEFRPGYTRCDECGVALVPDRPAHLTRRARWLDDAVTFDLSTWSEARRRTLDAWVFADNVPSVWEEDGSRLVVPANRAEDVDDLIAMIAANADDDAPEPEPEDAP